MTFLKAAYLRKGLRLELSGQSMLKTGQDRSQNQSQVSSIRLSKDIDHIRASKDS